MDEKQSPYSFDLMRISPWINRIFFPPYTFLDLCPLLAGPGKHPLKRPVSSPTQKHSQKGNESPGVLTQDQCIEGLRLHEMKSFDYPERHLRTAELEIFFSFVCLLVLAMLWHAEVPRPGTELVPQQ